jgi:hypothetical protein
VKRAILVAIAAAVAVLAVEWLSGGRISFSDTERGVMVASITAAVMAARGTPPAGAE